MTADEPSSDDPAGETLHTAQELFRWRRTVLAEADLPNRAKVTAMAIAERYNRQKGCAWPSMRKLAEDTGQSERSVRYAIAELRKAEFLLAERKHRASPYVYRLAYPSERQVRTGPPALPGAARTCRIDRQDGAAPGRHEPAGKPLSEPNRDPPISASRRKPRIGSVPKAARARDLDEAHLDRIRAALLAEDDYSDAERLSRLEALKESLGTA